MARARAAADEVEQARVDLLGASAVIASAVIQRKTTPGFAAVVAPKAESWAKPEPLPAWPKTEPYNEAWHDRSEVAPKVLSPLEKKLLADRRTPAKPLPVAKAQPEPQPEPVPRKPVLPLPASTLPAKAAEQRATVIPVPHLPTAADPRLVRPAPHTPSQPQPRGRMARGTGAPGMRSEETLKIQTVANDDRTSPYIELPSEVKPSGFAHTKRVAAKQP